MGKGRRSPAVSLRSFQDLKKIVELRHSEKKDTPSRNEKKASGDHNDDEALFREAMKDVQEIKEFREIPVNPPVDAGRRISPRINDDDLARCLDAIVSGRKRIELSCTQEYVQWKHPDCTDEMLRNLRTGKYSVQEFVDFHGLTLQEAETALEAFITGAVRKGLRCVKVIHGRGLRSSNGPVLKNAVTFWLSRRYRKYVLCFVTARQCDGGLGALYILLRRR